MNVVEILQHHGIKPSVQRMSIMNYLMEHCTHPTVDEIYSALSPTIPTLSKTTVYNTLKLLCDHGAAQTLTIDERNTCYDANTAPHVHFFCRCCGRVYDLPSNPTLMNTNQIETGKHQIDEVHYYCKGICQACQAEKEETNN